MDLAIAKRILSKKCLWLVRVSTLDIARMHIAELAGRFNPEAQGLDIIEIAAIFACIPTLFPNDPDHRKERWRASIEQNLNNLLAEKIKGSLTASKQRCPVYKAQIGLFAHRESLHVVQAVSSSQAFMPRSSFKNMRRPDMSDMLPTVNIGGGGGGGGHQSQQPADGVDDTSSIYSGDTAVKGAPRKKLSVGFGLTTGITRALSMRYNKSAAPSMTSSSIASSPSTSTLATEDSEAATVVVNPVHPPVRSSLVKSPVAAVIDDDCRDSFATGGLRDSTAAAYNSTRRSSAGRRGDAHDEDDL